MEEAISPTNTMLLMNKIDLLDLGVLETVKSSTSKVCSLPLLRSTISIYCPSGYPSELAVLHHTGGGGGVHGGIEDSVGALVSCKVVSAWRGSPLLPTGEAIRWQAAPV